MLCIVSDFGYLRLVGLACWNPLLEPLHLMKMLVDKQARRDENGLVQSCAELSSSKIQNFGEAGIHGMQPNPHPPDSKPIHAFQFLRVQVLNSNVSTKNHNYDSQYGNPKYPIVRVKVSQKQRPQDRPRAFLQLVLYKSYGQYFW